MSFKDSNKAKDNLGNVVQFAANSKGTGTPHVPSSIQLRSKDYGLGAVVNPDTDGNRVPPRFMDNPPGEQEGTKQVINTFTQNKYELPAVANPSGDRDRSKSTVASKSKA